MPNHPNRSFNSSELMEAAKHRGIVIHPWTYTGMTLFNEDMRMGVQFLTSNGAEVADRSVFLIWGRQAHTFTLKQNIAENVKATAISRSWAKRGSQCRYDAHCRRRHHLYQL